MTSKTLIIGNSFIVLFFIFIYAANLYQLNFALVGVFRELFTIPFLIAQVVFLIFATQYILKNSWNTGVLLSGVLLLVCTILTLGSFLL